MLIATNTVQRPKKYFQVSIVGSCEVETGERNLLHYAPSTHELVFKPVASFHYGYKECKNQLPYNVLWAIYIVLRTIYIM